MKITIVDDERSSLNTIERILKNMGHTVYPYTSAEEALASMPGNGSKLVLSDIRMPGMSGFDLMRGIKNHPGLKDVDIVLFTGFSDIKDAVMAIREGACDYIEKPVKMSDLIKLVNRISESRRNGKKPTPSRQVLVNVQETTIHSSDDCFPLDEAVLRTVKSCLERCNGNKSKTARYLGIPRNRLYNYLRKLEELERN